MAAGPVFLLGDVVNDVLNVARARVNDMVLTAQGYPGGAYPGWQFNEVGGGDTSSGVNPDGSLILQTQVMFNTAWRRLQKYLSDLGYRLFTADNVPVRGLNPNTNPDPTIQSWISWNGYFDGNVLNTIPVLPGDFYSPLKVYERTSGLNSFYSPMRNALEGLRNQLPRGPLNPQDEWRQGALYLPGATGPTDLLLEYRRKLSDYPDPLQAPLPWYYQILPVPDCQSSLAWFVAAEVLALRSNQDTADAAIMCDANAKNEADMIFNAQARGDQRPLTVRQGVARAGDRGGPGTSGAGING